jgi:hypothetical protein
MFKRTNLENKGLISADRNNKATLLLTIPRFVFKSSAKDLSPPISNIVFRWLEKVALPRLSVPPYYDARPKSIGNHLTWRG